MARKATHEEFYALIRACMGSSDGDKVPGVADFSATNGDRDKQHLVFVAKKDTKSEMPVTGDEFLSLVDGAEYGALDADWKRDLVRSYAAMKSIDLTKDPVKAALIGIFGGGSTTIGNMQAAFQINRTVWEWACDMYGPGAPGPVPGDESDPLNPQRKAPVGAHIIEAWKVAP